MAIEQQVGRSTGARSARPRRRATSYRRAGRELIDVVRHSFTWRALALADIRSKYRRTALGPWWLTASNGLMAVGIGVVFGGFFGSDQRTYIPFFITGMTVWNFISSAINESSSTLVQSSELIKATQMPLATYVMRAVQRNFLIFMHNIMIVPVIWLFQIIFQAIAPLVDLQILISLLGFALALFSDSSKESSPLGQSISNLQEAAVLYLVFFGVEMVSAMIAFRMERKRFGSLWWLFLQRFVYRQVMYAVIYKSLIMAVRGARQGWGKLDRTARVKF